MVIQRFDPSDRLLKQRLGPAAGSRGATGTVVITGGSSGIGRCTAALFGRRGWSVGLIARGDGALEAARQELVLAGGKAATATADVADSAAVEAAAAQLEGALGPIDIWINCAGNGVYGGLLDVSPEEFERVTLVTYLGTVNGTRAALRRMAPRNAGTVVNVCSAIAFHGMPLLSSYSGAKHAVRGFSEAVRAELAQDRSLVRLCTVYPPAVNTPFFSHAISHMALPPRPIRPVYQPEIVADAIFFMANSRRREMRVAGTTVAFSFFNRLAPWLIDQAILRLGYAGQMTDSAEALRLRDTTLFAPSGLAGGTHGPFNAGARRFSVQMWMARHRPFGLIALAALAALAAVLTLR